MVITLKQVKSIHELHMYISLIKQNKNLNINNYEEVNNELINNFDISLDKDLYQSYVNLNNVYIDELDTKLIHKHLGLNW